MDMLKTGGLVAARRKQLGMTQEELGSRLGVTDKAVSKWERGISCPDIALLNRLAAELRLSAVELLSGEVNDAAKSSYIPEQDVNALTEVIRRRPSELRLSLDGGHGAVVSPYLFGENMEHTRSNVFMGLSAQMLRNRKFAGKPAACSGHSAEWYPIGEMTYFAHSEPYTRHDAQFYHMNRRLERNAQTIACYSGEGGMGQHALTFREGRTYEFRMVARVPGETAVRLSLTDRGGRKTYAQAELRVCGDEWRSYEATLCPTGSDDDGDLRICIGAPDSLHLGAVSLMPQGHFRGMRRDVIDRLKEMGVRMLRWPGGNFAGEYCWADGLMPVDMRAPFESYMGLETQPHSMGYDYHEINTDDFIALCREVGAEPFITINPAWNSAEENAAWVEYCNGGLDTKYGSLRAERGFAEPYGVRFWSLGNEVGYGHMEGDNTPYGYSAIAAENARRMLAVSPQLSLCSSGPYPNRDWSEHSAKPLSGVAQLVSLHYYAPVPGYEDPRRLEESYYRCLGSVEIARDKARELRSQLSEALKISYDEWNTWYAWYRPGGAIEGLFTALMLQMLIGEAESCGIVTACHFEAINEGMMRVRPDGTSALTAAGQAFSLLQLHAGGSLRHASAEAVITQRESLTTVTAVNISFDKSCTVKLPALGGVVRAQAYVCARPDPFSGFEVQTPECVRAGEELTVHIPPRSLLVLQMRSEIFCDGNSDETLDRYASLC